MILAELANVECSDYISKDLSGVRRDNGQFEVFRNEKLVQSIGGKKVRFCRCCKQVINLRNPQAVYCKNCARYMQKLRYRIANGKARLRKKLQDYEGFFSEVGHSFGRVKQMVEGQKATKKRSNYWRARANYYKRKLENQGGRE